LIALLVAGHAGAALNVHDFGAVGDGLTDDTAAIQKAMLAVRAAPATPELVFPAGTYRITAPILVPGSVALRGLAGARLVTVGDHDLLYVHGVRRVSIVGLTFMGGTRHIRLQPDEKAFGTATISGCTFMQAAGFAIECMSLIEPASKQPLVPYRVQGADAGGPARLVPQDEGKGAPTTCPIKLAIERCSFTVCNNAVSALCEMATVTDCSVETDEQMRGGAFRSSGRFLLDRLRGVAHPTQGLKQHWVTALGGSVTLRQSTFESRANWGLCAVYALRTGEEVASSVVIDGCSFAAFGNEERCLVYCHQIPNLVAVRESLEMTDHPVDILGFSKPYDRQMLLALRHYETAALDDRFCFDLEQGNQGLVANVPKALETLAASPLPEGLTTEFRTKPYEVPERLPEEPRKILNLREFGAVGDGVADDSKALAKALRKLHREDLLLVPAGRYKLGDTVRIPSRARILGEGLPVFELARSAMVGLQAKKALDIRIAGCGFVGGKTALEVSSAPDRETFVQLRQCAFTDASGPAILCLSGNGRAREPNRSRMRVSDCEFRDCAQVLQANFDRTHLAGCFIATKRGATQEPVVDSMGRSMVAEDIYGLPQLGVASETADPRWFDAYGRLFCRNVRFGREDGGMCLAFLRPGERGDVEAYIEDSETWCAGNRRRKAMLYCDVLPRLIAVRNCVADPTPLLTVSADDDLAFQLSPVVRTSANLFPVRLPKKE
jgi:hypothetical protein